MDHSVNIEELQRKADDFLQGLLQVSRSSSRDTARHITNLAFEDGNPVRELFVATASLERARPSSPAETVRPRSSHRGLAWLSRHRAESTDEQIPHVPNLPICQPHPDPSAAAAVTPHHGPVAPAPSVPGGQSMQANPMRPSTSASVSRMTGLEFPGRGVRSYFSNAPKSTKACGSAPYNCIICNCDLSSKGVCKRHLEDQHVVLKTYECEKCRQPFENKSEAKKHCGQCGGGVFYFITVKPEAKKMYGCEFTGERFQSLRTYIDHLVRLCEKRANRPERSTHRKLCALLDHPTLRQPLQETSDSILRSPNSWKDLEWPASTMSTAIRQLEFANIQENGTIEFATHSGRRESQDIRTYVDNLLRAGELKQQNTSQEPPIETRSTDQLTQSSSIPSRAPSRSSVSTAVHDSVATPLTIPTPPNQSQIQITKQESVETQSRTSSLYSAPVFDDVTGIVKYEQKNKRPLSDQSRLYVPDRYPPGPPVSSPDFAYNDPNQQQFSPHTPQMHDAITTSLPYRKHAIGLPYMPPGPTSAPTQMGYPDHQMQQTVLSDAASESTVAQSYQEPELVPEAPFGNYWNPANLPINAQMLAYSDGSMYDFPNPNYSSHNGSSIRTPSVATGHTYVGSVIEEQKMASFDLNPPNVAPGSIGTSFFLDDSEIRVPELA